VGVGVGVGLTTATPLFQNNFLPDLMQVYIFLDTVDVEPNFEQVDPAFSAA
jgi:uncharacterized protein Usg